MFAGEEDAGDEAAQQGQDDGDEVEHGLESGEEGGQLGLELGDAVGVGLGCRKICHADQVLVGHLGVAEHLAPVFAGYGQAVFRSRPGQSVLVDVWHRSFRNK